MAKDKFKPLPSLTQSNISRFWMYVNKTQGQGPHGDCWEWLSSKNKGGYGRFHIGKQKAYTATRIAYLIHFGEDPGQLIVCHTCDNPPCVNPSHLWKGTHQDNRDDCVSKKRNFWGEGDHHGSKTHPERVPRGDRHVSRTHPEKVVKGETHPLVKLTSSQVIELISLYQSGMYTQRNLGSKFGVCQAQVSRIIKGQRWKCLSLPLP